MQDRGLIIFEHHKMRMPWPGNPRTVAIRTTGPTWNGGIKNPPKKNADTPWTVRLHGHCAELPWSGGDLHSALETGLSAKATTCSCSM